MRQSGQLHVPIYLNQFHRTFAYLAKEFSKDFISDLDEVSVPFSVVSSHPTSVSHLQCNRSDEKHDLSIRSLGTDITFRIYGVLCLLLVLLFIYLHQKYQHHDLFNQLQADVTANRNCSIDDPHEFVGDSPLLTPYGAPANPKWQRRISAGTKKLDVCSLHR